MTNNTASYRKPSAQARKKSPQPVAKILSLALKQYGIDKEVARYEFVLHWAEIVGETIAKRTRPESFQGSALVIRVTNPQWAQELVFQKDIIISRLNRFLLDSKSAQAIDDVRFVVGDISGSI